MAVILIKGIVSDCADEDVCCNECAECEGESQCIEDVNEEFCFGRCVANSTPFATIQISETMLYGIGGLIALLLVLNIACLCYYNCCSNANGKRSKYSKVEMIASSDDDMENLKEIHI